MADTQLFKQIRLDKYAGNSKSGWSRLLNINMCAVYMAGNTGCGMNPWLQQAQQLARTTSTHKPWVQKIHIF